MIPRAVLLVLMSLLSVPASGQWHSNPTLPLTITDRQQCVDYQAECNAVSDERLKQFHGCNDTYRTPKWDGFEDMNFPACDGQTYGHRACSSKGQASVCGVRECNASVIECYERLRNNAEPSENAEEGEEDLYDQVFEKGKRWHDAQLSVRRMPERDKSRIRKIIEANLDTLRKRHRALLAEGNRALRQAQRSDGYRSPSSRRSSNGYYDGSPSEDSRSAGNPTRRRQSQSEEARAPSASNRQQSSSGQSSSADFIASQSDCPMTDAEINAEDLRCNSLPGRVDGCRWRQAVAACLQTLLGSIEHCPSSGAQYSADQARAAPAWADSFCAMVRDSR